MSSVFNRVYFFSEGPPPDGSWTCESCGNVNYPFRTKCNRRNCGADKPTESKPSVNSAAQVLASDQVCGVSDCKLHQVNMEIFEILLVLGVGVFWMIIVYWTACRCSMISALSISALNGIVVLLLLLFVAVSTHSPSILSFGGEFLLKYVKGICAHKDPLNQIATQCAPVWSKGLTADSCCREKVFTNCTIM